MSRVLFKKALRSMGNRFEFSIVAKNKTVAKECFEAAITEVKQLETLLTTFSGTSHITPIYAMAGFKPVIVDQEVFNLFYRANRISELTQGAFDISYSSVYKRFWNFDTTMKVLPSPAVAKTAVRLINYRNIRLDTENNTVSFKRKRHG